MNVAGTPLPMKQLDPSGPRAYTLKDLIMSTPFAADAVIVKRQVFNLAGFFDTSLRSSEDRDMWIRIGACGGIYRVPTVVTLCRDHANSMSKHAGRMKTNTGKVLHKAYASGRVSRWDLPFWMKVHSFRYFQSAWMFADQGDSMKAISEMFRSLLLWPLFLDHTRFNEPLLFRLRALFRFGLSLFRNRQDAHG